MTEQSNGNNADVDAAPTPVSHWLIVAGTLIVATLALIPTLFFLWPQWSDGYTYSHGPLIVPLVFWLIFRQRHAVAGIEQRPCKPAFVVLAGLLFGWTWAFAANIAAGTEALWPLILVCSVLAVSGWHAAMKIAVPVLLLYSAIPVWDAINPFLQSLTTKAVAVILQLVSVPAFIQGNFVQIPAGVFEIAGGCSGLNFFIVAITLAVVYGHLHYQRTGHTVLLLAIASVASIMMNWIRVAAIITVGHLTDMQSPIIDDHYTLGWVLFAVMLIPFYFVARRLERGSTYEVAPKASSISSTHGHVAPAGVALFLLALPVLMWGRLVTNEATDIAIELPDVAGWQLNDASPTEWQPRFPNPDGEVQATYAGSRKRLDVYANWYETQSQGRELIGFGTTLAGDKARVFYDKRVAVIDSASPHKSLEIHEIMADYQTGERRLIWYHFLVGGESQSLSIEAQLRLGLLAMVGAEQSGTIAVSAICDGRDCEDARALLADAFGTFNAVLTDTLMASTEE